MEFDSKIIKIRQETHDVKTFRFWIPDNFNFIAGQFIMLELDMNGKDVRPFSISSSPTEKGFMEITKKITQGIFGKKLDSMSEGLPVHIKGPFGFFTLDENHDAVMLAGGIGITPFRSMIKYSSARKLENKITLFYSNKTPEDIAFMEELRELEGINQNLKIINTITRPEEGKEWSGLVGRIDESMIKQNLNDFSEDIFYVCGPPAMVDAMVGIVKNIGIQKERIKIERFFGY